MKILLRESERSTPEKPLWVWHVVRGNQKIAFGVSPSEEDARQQAELAVQARERKRTPAFFWGPSL